MNELTTQIVTGVACTALGGVLGWRFATLSDRRKEYNELADPLFTKVNQTLEPYAGSWFHISDTEVEQIRRRMGWLHRKRFDAAIAAYQQASAERAISDGGESYFTNVNEVNESLRRIAKALHRR